MKSLIVSILLISITILVADQALARDAVEMGAQAQTYFLRIGVATVGVGISIAGILYSIGLGHWGRTLLTNGGIGAAIILGIKAVLKIFSTITGSSL